MKVSIIIIFDKFRRDKLTRLLNSLKSQVSQGEAEIVLIHESKEPLQNLNLPIDVRYVTVTPKQGIPYNRNQGILHAKGNIIVFIDDDCWVQDRWLSSLLRPLEADSTLLASTGETRVPKSNFIGDCIAKLGFPGGGSLGFDKMWKISGDSLTNHLAVGNCAMKKEIFRKVGLFDESMKCGAEDAEFSFRMERSSLPIKFAPGAYAFHEARTSLGSFVQWQLRRGRANHQFKKKVGKVGSFVKLRLWSAKNIIKENADDARLPFVLSFLVMSFVLQQMGYLAENYFPKHTKRRKPQH